jgi:hypothetical protein
MHGSERTSANLLFDHVLVDSVFSGTIILASVIFGSSVERFLPRAQLAY